MAVCETEVVDVARLEDCEGVALPHILVPPVTFTTGRSFRAISPGGDEWIGE